jgi:hypothetical protein
MILLWTQHGWLIDRISTTFSSSALGPANEEDEEQVDLVGGR